jgi:nanoRNase/pAp phosphatase (c-di-AMP/oligoRNAs hydrolase)
MANFYDFSPVQKALTTAQSISIALPKQLDYDKVAAGLSLFLSLKKIGKEVNLLCAEEMTVRFSHLVGVDKINKEVGGNNLVIAFDYIEDSIEKVSYNIEEGKFNLVIQPKEGFPPLSMDKVKYLYAGGKRDMIFVIGSASLEELGEIYQKNKEVFKKEKIVNLDNHPNNNQFGGVNIVDREAPSCSEIVYELLSKLRLPVDVDIASNLFQGLQRATRNFSSPGVRAGTFEAAAFCLRAGVKRGVRKPLRREEKKGEPLKPMPAEVSAARPPDLLQPGEPEEEKTEEPAPDWLEPKIYKGDTRL